MALQRAICGPPRQDVAAGLARIQRAADEDYGPAMFFIGNAKYGGTLLPKDAEAGLKLIQESAVLGDVEAHYMLGQMYENGIGVPIDRERAKRYYRLCAAKATAACEFRLGQLLLAVNGDQEPKRLEAIAWLELAEGHDIPGADKAASAARANSTEEQKRWVSKLAGQLEQRP